MLYKISLNWVQINTKKLRYLDKLFYLFIYVFIVWYGFIYLSYKYKNFLVLQKTVIGLKYFENGILYNFYKTSRFEIILNKHVLQFYFYISYFT